ncbi:hypothetical protein BDY17DRAFT_10792 [Neohortaea acidophila]|uniref:Uncharacterized protein n=1 Tax=Neohortaea acidophila TaxID=245834 RepID=A0A6A6Q526_9PEZI|nr:uncharacterized protein BDY17DRAFT_10792 [Neohortaea acidophila]KAF2487402.1 hypothetical protein BDY17DRAFT_10792 [Neohortaea acidophila]
MQPRITTRCQHPFSPIEDLFSDWKAGRLTLYAAAVHPRLIMVEPSLAPPHTTHYIPLISLVIVRSPKSVFHPSHGNRSDGGEASAHCILQSLTLSTLVTKPQTAKPVAFGKCRVDDDARKKASEVFTCAIWAAGRDVYVFGTSSFFPPRHKTR